MRQVPTYLIIGGGRLATHFNAYFSMLDIPWLQWTRHQSLELLDHLLSSATHVLVLIRDDAIVPFIQNYLKEYKGTIVHCSGVLSTELAFGAHPLMSFTQDRYSLEQYRSVPFFIDEDAPAFEEVLPGLPNRYHRIKKSDKIRYHALCVMGGNFSCMLWQQLFSFFEDTLQCSREYVFPYLTQQMKNVMKDSEHALTGPLVRGDDKTIASHLVSLDGSPLRDLYLAFINFYKAMNTRAENERV